MLMIQGLRKCICTAIFIDLNDSILGIDDIINMITAKQKTEQTLYLILNDKNTLVLLINVFKVLDTGEFKICSSNKSSL